MRNLRYFGFASAILLPLLVGCKGSSTADNQRPSTDAGAGKKLTVAVIPKSIGGDFWETVEAGARAAGRDLGVEIKWEGAHLETELAEQNKIIENMVNLGVDGMALAPLNNRTMRRPVERVVAAGIPVVIFDSAVDGDAHISYVATNNHAAGAMAGEYLIERLRDRGKKVFLLRYIQGTASTEQRSDGFIEAIEAGGLELLAQPYSDDATVAGGIKAATNTLERFVRDGKLDADGMFATNLYSTMGLLAALEDLRRSGVEVDAVVVGFDSSPKLVEDIQAGRLDALISQKPHRMGYLAVETLVKHLRGEEVEPLIDTGAELVTRERLENEPEIRELVGLK